MIPCDRPHIALVRRTTPHRTSWVLRCDNCGLVMVEIRTPNRWQALRPGTRFCLTVIAISVVSVVAIVLAVASGWST